MSFPDVSELAILLVVQGAGRNMARLTKTEIKTDLLKGKALGWKDVGGKASTIALPDPKQRRLLAYLLDSKIREVKNIPDAFCKGLAAAFIAAGDPAADNAGTVTQSPPEGPWKIHAIKTKGFGGVNAWNGPEFELELEKESLLLDGPNGSGKSSLTAAVVWALTGERPRDQSDAPASEVKPILSAAVQKIGEWPPVATYPKTAAGIISGPDVRVEVVFSNPAGKLASVVRALKGTKPDYTIDPILQLPSVLLETGLLMPARLPKIRFDSDNKDRLTAAVQALTGLDELIELGVFVQGLCHKGRDYLSYKSNELDSALRDFNTQIEAARTALAPVGITIPSFKPSDTDDANGAFAILGKSLSEKAAELTKVVSDDLAPGLNTSDAQVQKQIVLALADAEKDIDNGLAGSSTWTFAETVAHSLDATARAAVAKAVAEARTALAAAIGYHQAAQADNRYQLKALAARWHADHGSGAVGECPMCTHSLADNPSLQTELTALQTAGESATRKLSDNVNAIRLTLEASLPQSLKKYLADKIPASLRVGLVADLIKALVSAERYSKTLTKFASLAQNAINTCPTAESKAVAVAAESIPGTSAVLNSIQKLEQLVADAEWFENEQANWTKWWKTVSKSDPLPNGSMPETDPETLSAHITRLSKSMGEAEPFRLGAAAMRLAWAQGVKASAIAKEIAQRQDIADALAPLKTLDKCAEAQTRDALNDLSGRIGKIHGETYISDAVQFQGASLEKKIGLVIHGAMSNEICVDATLVANTSWVRGVLWAFIFALREEAVEQAGMDQLPILVLDDPQQTFDSEHRHRWAEQIAKLQKATTGVQIMLGSYDEQFLSLLEIDGVSGRHAMLASAGTELGHIGVFDGDELNRRWARVSQEKTPKAAQAFMAAMRVFVEGMLRLMLRGEDIDTNTALLGECREKIRQLHASKNEPWARKVFDDLVGALGKGISAIKYIEVAHHATGAQLGMTEAIDVQKYWTATLRPTLERAFRIVREHRALHGGLTALHALPPSVSLPEGYKAVVKTVTLPVVGSAAALSDGKAADGCMDLNINGSPKEVVELKDHFAFRLTAATLEPVGRPGDLILVREHQEPTAKSLVIAMSDDRLLARRLEIADNHSDVAVLTANAINPRKIAPPVVAKLSTLSLHKVVGVLYGNGDGLGHISEHEFCDCGGEASVKSAFSNMQRLVTVKGQSAEPHALDGQFLIIAKQMPLAEALIKLQGAPVIVEDSDGLRYFKRLRSGPKGYVIMESLEIGGDFGPVLLGEKPGSSASIVGIWPVLGVLFEKPK
jgi:hypothetical protein